MFSSRSVVCFFALSCRLLGGGVDAQGNNMQKDGKNALTDYGTDDGTVMTGMGPPPGQTQQPIITASDSTTGSNITASACPFINAATSPDCSDCLHAGCVWAADECLSNCMYVTTGPCFQPSNTTSVSSVCATASSNVLDNTLCQAATSCEDCTSFNKTDGTPCEWYMDNTTDRAPWCGTGGCDMVGTCGSTTCEAPIDVNAGSGESGSSTTGGTSGGGSGSTSSSSGSGGGGGGSGSGSGSASFTTSAGTTGPFRWTRTAAASIAMLLLSFIVL